MYCYEIWHQSKQLSDDMPLEVRLRDNCTAVKMRVLCRPKLPFAVRRYCRGAVPLAAIAVAVSVATAIAIAIRVGGTFNIRKLHRNDPCDFVIVDDGE